MSVSRSQIKQEMLSPLDRAANQSSLFSKKPSLQASASSSQRLFIELSTELLRQGQRVRFKAPGLSMQPTIKEGEIITIQPIAPSAVSKGDIILYSLKRGLIAHRVVRILRKKGDAPSFIMRGDASDASDCPVSDQQVLGKVISVERGGRRINLYSQRARMRHMAHKWASRLKKLIKTCPMTEYERTFYEEISSAHGNKRDKRG